MLSLPKIDRRSWLALWAQGRRRARQIHLLPAPVLRPVYPDMLEWDWDLTNPYRWNVWLSNNGGVSWILVEDYWMSGDARQFAPDGGSELYYIVGVDEFGREITEHSNQVRPDDALLPAPVLRPAYPDLLQWDWDLANPVRWNVWMSLNDGATWQLIGDYWATGDARQFSPDGGSELYYIVGVDAGGNEITEHSNQVRPDDALIPAAWISVDAAAVYPATGQIGVSDVGDIYSNANFGGWVVEVSDDGESWATHQVVVQESGGADCVVNGDYGFYYRAWARDTGGNRISEYSEPYFYPVGSSAPVLSYDPDTLTLSWTGATEQNWGLYFSDNEGGPFTRVETLSAETFSANAGDHGEGYYYVQSLVWDTPNGDASNVVNVTF